MKHEPKQEEKFVSVDLLGQRYTFKTENDVAKANEIANLYVKEVNRVQKELTGKSSRPTDQVILILAALNIADKHYELEKKYADLKSEISDRSVNLINRLAKVTDWVRPHDTPNVSAKDPTEG